MSGQFLLGPRGRKTKNKKMLPLVLSPHLHPTLMIILNYVCDCVYIMFTSGPTLQFLN